MKFPIQALLYNVPAVVCFMVAAYLASNEKSGWGWFIAAGVLCLVTPSKHRGE